MKLSLKLILFLCWVFIFGIAYSFFINSGLSMGDLLKRMQRLIAESGVWGPVTYIGIYSLRSLFLFPASLLTTLAGLLFGPLIGIFSTLIGENISANVSFVVGRYFGHGIFKRLGIFSRLGPFLECGIKEHGFVSVLTMRLVYLPFDLVGYGSGACGIRHRDFAMATGIGTIPGLVTFIFLGSAITEPKYFLLVGLFLIVGITLSRYLRTRTSLPHIRHMSLWC